MHQGYLAFGDTESPATSANDGLVHSIAYMRAIRIA